MQKEARGRLAGSGTVAECVGAEEEEDKAWRRCRRSGVDPVHVADVVDDDAAARHILKRWGPWWARPGEVAGDEHARQGESRAEGRKEG